MRSRIGAVTVLLVAGLALAACGGGDDPSGDPAGDGSVSPDPTASSSPIPTAAPWQPLAGELDRCGPQPAAAAEAGFAAAVIDDAEVGRIKAVTAGSGPTVAVLLHQTDGNGLCGWLPYAAELVAEPGVRILAIDLCGYGESACTGDRSSGPAQVDAVAAAVREARTRMDAQRVVVVGASMGGSVALMAAASPLEVDAAVDLSGPVDWDGMDLVDDGRALRVPVLVAMADGEGEDQVAGARAIVDEAPDGSRFEPAESGHGYDLLLDRADEPTALGTAVIEWIRGE